MRGVRGAGQDRDAAARVRAEGVATRVYLDWAAGAPLHPAAARAAAALLASGPGNPSSVHAEGRAARAVLERAREQVAALACCQPGEIVFTASGSEANALALRSTGRVLAGAIEHPSVRLAARLGSWASFGSEPSGLASLPELSALLREGAAVVALQLVNHETGVIQPVAEAAALARNVGARFHCDAVQGAGKLPLADLVLRADTVAISAHKLGGLPGAGALVVRKGVELTPVIAGHQERGRRGGTPGLVAIAAFGAAAAAAVEEREARLAALAARTAELTALLRRADPSLRIHGEGAERCPGIVSGSFPGADGELLLVALDLAGVACSHGAACASGALEPSSVLLSMGLSREQAAGAIRFSCGASTSPAELELLAAALPGALAAARAVR